MMTLALYITSVGGIAGLIIDIIIIAACIAVLFVLCRVFGVNIPPWVIQIFWICLAAAVGIVAIKFLLSL